jgi:hypothetical protein
MDTGLGFGLGTMTQDEDLSTWMNRIYRITKYILCILYIHVIFKGEGK